MSSRAGPGPGAPSSPPPASPATPRLGSEAGPDEPDAPTTFCKLLPRMSPWKFSGPAAFLSRSPSSAGKELAPAAATKGGGLEEAAAPGTGAGPGLAAVLGACEPVCASPCSLQLVSRCRGAAGARQAGAGAGARGVGPGARAPQAGDEWSRKGSFIHKPPQGWLHPDDRVLGPGVSYIVRYMGCIEVLRSMRSLDFNTRTQVTREAINRLYEAVPGVRGAWKKKAPNKALFSILGKSNLRFAGMSITINISIDGLNLMVPTTRQVSSNPGQPCDDGYLQADSRPLGSRDYEEHMYVNTQNLESWETEPAAPEESPKKDLFDMRPFEDALKLHECSVSSSGPVPIEDQWPSPPTRRAPIAPTEEQLRREPWYHGKMSRRAAEKLLRADGDFLVRDSVTNPGQYVLTGMHGGQPKHLLLVDPEGVVRTKDVLFESISHLIDYHLQNGQPILAAESELHLRDVVKRES
ncbi:SHC-transforming protein 2 [Gracilinanus agilis]|uniref:SHC-transforming protein 2 n=1 Tax=Gracilinanus agilis TaxID=191870 RepID=UPI001CFE0A7E|nr:SHC-transforming protein 2 [Gracilinanus agilis]